MAKRKLIVPGSEADVMFQGLKNPKKLLNFLANQSKNTGTRVPLKNAGQGKVFASDVWKGYADKPGGQRLVISGTPASSSVKVSPLGEGPLGSITKKFYPATYEPDDIYSETLPPVRDYRTISDIADPTVRDTYERLNRNIWGNTGRVSGPEDLLYEPAYPHQKAGGKHWSEDVSRVNQEPRPKNSGWVSKMVLGDQNPPRSSIGYLPNRQSVGDAWTDAMRHRTYNPDIYEMTAPTPPARETWGGDLNLTMPKHPLTRRWIEDPSTILNMGNILNRMGRIFQGVDDRLERNRINRLMRFNTVNPYYRGGLY